MAFYDVAGVLPTHVYFLDFHQNSHLFLQYIFDICVKNKISNISFLLSERLKYRIFYPSSSRTINQLKYLLSRVFKKFVLFAPAHCHYTFLRRTKWLKGGKWAESLEEPLYHYRSSLTAALNYMSIVYPGRRIKLVGIDLNSPTYFFESRLKELNFDYSDWTTPITRERSVHASVLDHQGTTLMGKLDFVISELEKTGNEVVSCNRNSLLVEKGFVKHARVCG